MRDIQNLAGFDAMHLAAAAKLRAVEFITTEKPTKPMFGFTGVKIISIV